MTVELPRRVIELEILRGMAFDQPWWERAQVWDAVRAQRLRVESFSQPKYGALFRAIVEFPSVSWVELEKQFAARDGVPADTVSELFVPPLLSPQYLTELIAQLTSGDNGG